MEEKKQINFQKIYDKVLEFLGFYGVVYIFVLIALVVFGAIYVNKIKFLTSSTLMSPAIDSIANTKIEDLQMKKGSLSPPVDVSLYINPSQEILDKGKEIYNVQCASCHGEDGQGNGPAGATLNPPPRNFHDLNGWTNGPEFDRMYLTLQDGILKNGMASYSNLPPEERLAMISYIRTFNENYPEITESDMQTLDATYSLSAGSVTPNQIPVSLAMEKLIEEYKPTEEKVDAINLKISSDNSPQALSFKNLTTDIKRALRSLLSNPGWNENQNAFVNFIITDPVQKGFKAGVSEISNEQWTELFNYVQSVIGQTQTGSSGI
ncbi:MAG: Cytochrome c subfamily protein [Chlorobi bacterium OLB4]|jgi:Cytochrome c, mono- and diheme variants|nr:MAG: Cytochrome c subfamily protein [Chlorobi bacterium OLB4]MBW7855106.1 cytochrome c [Ignavibacteria bacterium]OQY76707.1 MAG: hypothetical protein B6D43_08755 [Ignavibacteriales bacterium UTCHB1]